MWDTDSRRKQTARCKLLNSPNNPSSKQVCQTDLRRFDGWNGTESPGLLQWTPQAVHSTFTSKTGQDKGPSIDGRSQTAVWVFSTIHVFHMKEYRKRYPWGTPCRDMIIRALAHALSYLLPMPVWLLQSGQISTGIMVILPREVRGEGMRRGLLS